MQVMQVNQVMQIIQETQVIHVMQDWNRVLVSLISWPGQLLSLFSCERLKFLARMLFLGILYWFRKSLPRSIYSISILLLEFIFPFVRPSEYIIIPEVCAQGWYSSSTPVLFVEFGSFFLTFCSSQPSIVHWLSSPIFLCQVVWLFVRLC